MSFCDILKLLTSPFYALCGYKFGNFKGNNTGNNVVENNGNVYYIHFDRPETEDKNILLTHNEEELLSILADGSEISYVRNGSGEVAMASVFGFVGDDRPKSDEVIKLLPPMYRKGVIDKKGEDRYIISPVGRRIIQRLDETARFGK